MSDINQKCCRCLVSLVRSYAWGLGTTHIHGQQTISLIAECSARPTHSHARDPVRTRHLVTNNAPTVASDGIRSKITKAEWKPKARKLTANKQRIARIVQWVLRFNVRFLVEMRQHNTGHNKIRKINENRTHLHVFVQTTIGSTTSII